MTTKKDEALKLALEALQELVAQNETSLFAMQVNAHSMINARGVMKVIREALAEQPAQQQEHVSVMTVLHLKDRTEIGYGPASAGYDLPTGEYKLYTSPPASKPWVGLTPDDHIELARAVAVNKHQIRAIEAKLREKNA